MASKYQVPGTFKLSPEDEKRYGLSEEDKQELREVEEKVARDGTWQGLTDRQKYLIKNSSSDTPLIRAVNRGMKRYNESKPDAVSGPQGKNPQAGLLNDLFNKSADELEKLEEEEMKKGKPEEKPPEGMSEEDRKTWERVMKFRREEREKKGGKGSVAGGMLDGEFDEFALQGDPMTHHLQGQEPATSKEEAQMKKVVDISTNFIFGDRMHTVIRALKGAQQPGEDGGPAPTRELYQTLSETAVAILSKGHHELINAGEKPEASVFFSETGATPIVIDQLWRLAQKVGLPGSEDKDQYAAAIINTMKIAGEKVIESGDEDAISEAEELATQMAMTRPDGTMIETAEQAADVERTQFQKKELAGAINTGLLGAV